MSSTSRLVLDLQEGADFLRREPLNANFTKLDKQVGVFYCTSTTRPTTDNYPGRLIQETDTGIKLLRTADNSDWEVFSSSGGSTIIEGTENRFASTSVKGGVGSRLTVPTHVTPAGGQSTHPSVLYIPEGFGPQKYTYWMAHTPYPGGSDAHEDPNIVAGYNGINWSVPPGLTNPIDNQPGSPGAYNSDVDLRMGPGRQLYLFWRTFDPNASGAEEKLYYSTSYDGFDWSPKVMFYSSSITVRRLLSPSLLFDEDHWVMYAVNIFPSPNQVVILTSNGTTPDSGWSSVTNVSVGSMQAGKEPWHIQIIKDGSQYVGLLNDCTIDASGSNGDLLFIRSDTGTSFENSGTSVIPRLQTGEHDNLYRASLIPAFYNGVRGYRVWYSAYLAGSPAVWNIYRTFITGTTTSQSQGGTINVPIINAGSTGANIAVTFPVPFASAPAVTLTPGSTRLTGARINVTATGFEAQFTNWTAANSSATTADWNASAK